MSFSNHTLSHCGKITLGIFCYFFSAMKQFRVHLWKLKINIGWILWEVWSSFLQLLNFVVVELTFCNFRLIVISDCKLTFANFRFVARTIVIIFVVVKVVIIEDPIFAEMWHFIVGSVIRIYFVVNFFIRWAVDGYSAAREFIRIFADKETRHI